MSMRMALGCTLAIGCGGTSAGGAPATTETAEVEATPSAAQVLRDMASRLAEADALTFEAVRRMDPELVEGSETLELANIAVAVKRPNEVYATIQNDNTMRRFYFDGQQVAIYDEATRYYAEAPMPGTIDAMVTQIDERFGFVPPLADFVVNDPLALMSQQVQTGQYLGVEPVGGERCHHIAVSGQLADAELWVGVESRLPRRLIAVYRAPGQPRLRVDFSAWNLQAELPDDMFSFEPPEGSTQVELLPAPPFEEAVQEEAVQ